jgi:transcriptional regulator with XRE-family HTH domain
MSDKELLQKLMKKNNWNQTQLAEYLGITQPQVSRVFNDKQNLRSAVRKLAEKLLEETQ